MKTQITTAFFSATLLVLTTSLPGLSLRFPHQGLSKYRECTEKFIVQGFIQKNCPIVTDVFDSSSDYA